VAAVLPPGPNVDSSVPVITGKAAVGSTLTAVPGNWGPTPVALNYRWYRSGTVISGAGRTTYALTPGDLGQTISVRVTGVKEGYTSVGRYSVPTPAVAAGALTAPTPAISGAVKVGSKLTALPGTWTAGTTLNYRWYRSGVSITGAGYPTYVLTPADLGAKISLRVTGVKPGYTTVGRYSPATAAVAPGTLTAPTPTISGSARVGYTLTANPGVWTSGTTLTYQWYRSGTAIAGATGRTYKVISTDRYDTLKVRVRGSKPAHTTAFRYSASTVRVP
jgi:hypothetical protein